MFYEQEKILIIILFNYLRDLICAHLHIFQILTKILEQKNRKIFYYRKWKNKESNNIR